jgi:hypothetical protein
MAGKIHSIEEVVSGAELLDDVFAFVRRFVSLTENQATVISVWIFHTHAFHAARVTPYLAILSPEKQSGKSLLLSVLRLLVNKPWFTGKVSAAVLVRKIAGECPTLLFDESDCSFGGDKDFAQELRGVLNTGYEMHGAASSCQPVGGGKFEFKDYATFCPKAIAGIGTLPDTVEDRSFEIAMKRAGRGEQLDRFRRRTAEPEAIALRKMIEVWVKPLEKELEAAWPALPDELTPRQQDAAEPLLAIADAAGGVWPQRLRAALIQICTKSQAEDPSITVRLLADIRDVFHQRGTDKVSSADLVFSLCDIETAPWSEWSRGKPLSTNKLARLLSRFEISPKTIRVAESTMKGYAIEWFADAWLRYLPGPTPAEKRNTVTFPPIALFPEDLDDEDKA